MTASFREGGLRIATPNRGKIRRILEDLRWNRTRVKRASVCAKAGKVSFYYHGDLRRECS